MGQSIQIAGATFSKVLASLTLPDRSALVAEYLFGTDFASSSRNLANPALPLLEVGAPAYGAGFATAQSGPSGTGFNTQITPLADCTIIHIRSTHNGVSDMYPIRAGNIGFMARSSNFIFKGGDYANLDQGAVNNNGANTWNFAAGVSNGGAGFARHFRGDASTGVLTAATAANARQSVAPGVLYVGTPNCTTTGSTLPCSTAYLAIFNRTLTQTEIDAAYQTLRPFMARRGISI